MEEVSEQFINGLDSGLRQTLESRQSPQPPNYVKY